MRAALTIKSSNLHLAQLLFFFCSPTIHVNVRTIRSPEDAQAEVDRMWRENQQQEEEAATADGHDKTVYDFSPTTTMEYDVVACE